MEFKECDSFFRRNVRACVVEAKQVIADEIVTTQVTNTNQSLNGYVGPSLGTIVPPETPNTVIFLPVAAGQENTWFAVSDANGATGTQDVLVASSSQGTPLTLGSAGGGGVDSVTLIPGTYDISLSLSLANSQDNVNFIVALGTLSPGASFSLEGTPFEVAPRLYHVSAAAITGSSAEAHNVAARGTLTVGSTLNNVGLLMQSNKDGNVVVFNISLTFRKVA
uniref:Uncharacterized protein n=1 Tax=viral metagenome TaxID=1070528 RepID=A0A6C0BN67_9ZZZZ